jgi:hypothetical protein
MDSATSRAPRSLTHCRENSGSSSCSIRTSQPAQTFESSGSSQDCTRPVNRIAQPPDFLYGSVVGHAPIYALLAGA